MDAKVDVLRKLRKTRFAMQCVINLTFQFFFIYLMMVCVSLDEFRGHSFPLLKNTMENALGTVAYCPMLAILFVATRMRA